LLLDSALTYDHWILNIALPVRSAVLKQDTGGLVLEFVRIVESPLLYVFFFLLFFELVYPMWVMFTRVGDPKLNVVHICPVLGCFL
jgi:hypothetical protein